MKTELTLIKDSMLHKIAEGSATISGKHIKIRLEIIGKDYKIELIEFPELNDHHQECINGQN